MVGYTSKLAILASAATLAMAAPAPVASPPADAFLPFANSRMARRSHQRHDDVKLVQLGIGTAILGTDRYHHHHARSPRKNKHHDEDDYPVPSSSSGKHHLSANAGVHADLGDYPESTGKHGRKGKSSSRGGKKGKSGSGSARNKHKSGKKSADLERRRHSGWWPSAWAGSAYYPRPVYSHPYYAQPVVVGGYGYGDHAHIHIHARDLPASSVSAAMPLATAAPATPGFVELALPLDHSDLAKPYAGLFVDPDDPETLSTSASKASQFFLEAFAPPASASGTPASASSAAAPMPTGHSFLAGDKLGNASVVQVRMPVMDAQSVAVSYACATIPTTDPKSALTMQPCGANDPTTSSQAFAYNSTTGELRPLMNELTHSATDGAVNGGVLRPLDHPVNVPAANDTDPAAAAAGTAVTSSATGAAVGTTPASPSLPISFFFVPAGPNQLAAVPPPASSSSASVAASSSAAPAPSAAPSSVDDGSWTPSTLTDSAPYDWAATSTASADGAAPTTAW